jgi:transposase
MSRAQIIPNPENASLKELETAAKCAPTMKAHSRYRAIIALIMGIPRESVAKIFGVSKRTVQRWIVAFNEKGIDGLIHAPRPGRPRKIAPHVVDYCRDILDHPEKANQKHWTGVKFHGFLKEELKIEVGYSTVIRFLHEKNYCLKVPRPWADRHDEVQREAFRQKIRELLKDPSVELWYGDESGFEGDPRPRRRWAKKGDKIKVTRNNTHIRMNATGIICPRTGEFYALEFTHSDSTVFQTFLDHANKDIKFKRPRQILIVDNASWHKAKKLNWGRFEVLYLPPYSPDLNPIERLWLLTKAEWFSDFIAKTKEDLIKRLDQALLWIIGRQELNKKTCFIRT